MDHTVGQSPSWLKHGHWQIRPYAIHLPSGPCRFSPTFRTSQGNGIAVAGVDEVCTVYLYHTFFLFYRLQATHDCYCSTWSFLPSLIWNLSLLFLGISRSAGLPWQNILGSSWLLKSQAGHFEQVRNCRVGVCSGHIPNHVSLNDRNLGPWVFPWVFWRSGIFAIIFRRDPWETLKLYYRYSTDFLTPKQLDLAKHTKVMVYWYLGQAMCKLTLCCAWRSSNVFL